MPKIIPSPTAKAARIAELLSLLEIEMSVEQVRIVIGCSNTTARHYIEILHDRGHIYISGWVVQPGKMAKLYTAGNKPDVPQPAWETKQKDDEEEDWPIVRELVNVVVRRDPLTAALFGEAA